MIKNRVALVGTLKPKIQDFEGRQAYHNNEKTISSPDHAAAKKESTY